MATVGVHGLRGNVQNAIDYILDPGKTEPYLSEGVGVIAEAAGISWKVKNQEKSKPTDLVGYHFRQSFEPGSITPEEAFEIGKEWIEKITQGNYDYVIATHVDKKHIHNHIIVNPKNNATRKDMNVFYKRDLNIFKKLSDDVCVEHGKRVLEFKGKQFEKTYYEWMLKNKGDSLKEVLRKSMDAIIPKVKDYQEFVKVMESLGFEVEDGTQKSESQIPKPSSYDITINKKMLMEPSLFNDHYMFRIPLTRDYIKIPKDEVTVLNEGVTFKTSLKHHTQYDIFDASGQKKESLSTDELMFNWDDKTKDEQTRYGRQGLRIKPPGASRFIRCHRMENNEHGEGFSLEDVIKRIENNGVFITSKEVKEMLSSKDGEGLKKQFFEDNHIHVSYSQSQYSTFTGKERYVYAKMRNIENTLKMMRESRSLINDIDNYEGLLIQRRNLVEDLKLVTSTLEEKNAEFETLTYERMEGRINASDEEVEHFMIEKILPPREAQMDLRRELKELDERILKVEKELKIERSENHSKEQR